MSFPNETKENENYAKLCRLLYDGGTLALKTEFDVQCPPATLAATLVTHQHKLKKFKGKVLNKDQWNLLYPSSGYSPTSKDFDIALLSFLLNNICCLPTPIKIEINKIRQCRNKVIAHRPKAEVSDTDFESYWKDISGALVSLGIKQGDVDKLKEAPLGEKDYNQLVEYWELSDKEVKQHLEEIKTTASSIQSDTEEIKTTASSIQSDTEEIKTTASAIQSGIAEIKSEMYDFKNTQHSAIDSLAYIDYTALINRNCRLHHPSTRQWIFEEVEEHLAISKTSASVVLIRAGPGMGKSIVAAKLCKIYNNDETSVQNEGSFLGGCHFFQHSNALRNNPRLMLQSIAKQLCNPVPGYHKALETKLKTLQESEISNMNCEELFGVLFEEPLSQINIDHNVVIVIDALDECASQFKEEIEDVLESKLCDLPSWMRFIITTRPLPSCCKMRPAFHTKIDPSDQRNQHDLKTFFVSELSKRNAEHLAVKLLNISDGIFLVAHFLFDILDENGQESVQEAMDCFPDGISSVYKHYFKRIQSVIKPFLDSTQSENNFFNMLEAVVASEGPIPKDIFYEILCLKSVDEVPREKRKDRNDAVHSLHTLFPVENDHVTVFHKTVTDWLKLDANQNPEFSVSVSNGREVLAVKCWSVLNAFKKREKPLDQPLVLSDCEMFLFKFGIGYIIESSQLSRSWEREMIKQCSIFIYAALINIILQRSNNLAWVRKFESDSAASFVKNFVFHDDIYRVVRLHSFCFGHWLSFAGGCLLNNESSPLSLEEKEKVRLWLILNKLPHCSHQTVFSNPLHVFRPHLCKITNGFIAAMLNNNDLDILTITQNGCIAQQKYLEKTYEIRGVSPDKKYLIITTTNSSKVELYDVTTLEKVQEYNCPIDHVGLCHIFEDANPWYCPLDHVGSCHIFGDANQWYIVVKVKGNPNIFILDGLNGQLDSIIKVSDSDELLAVSQCGKLLIGKCGEPEDVLGIGVAIDKIHSINVRTPDDEIYYNLDTVHLFFLSKFKRSPVRSDYYMFSDDGNYFAVCDTIIGDKDTVLVFNTNDGTLYRSVRGVFPLIGMCGIVFVSSSCLIVKLCANSYKSIFVFYDLVSSKQIYYAPVPYSPYGRGHLVVVPPQGTDKFIPALYGLNDNCDLIKVEFHCLEQNFLDSS